MIWDLTISDGYKITHRYFKKAESAQKAMAEMYYDLMIQYFDFGSRTTDELSEDEKYWYDCSSLSEYSAHYQSYSLFLKTILLQLEV